MSPAEKPARAGDAATAKRVTLAVLLALGFAVAGGWLAAAHGEYARSGSQQLSLAVRASSARAATRMAPWDARYRTRALVMSEWEAGAAALSAGDYNRAVDALAIAYRNDVGNAQLLALFQRAQDEQSLATVKKAHLQHGHEGPGGTLTPSQIER